MIGPIKEGGEYPPLPPGGPPDPEPPKPLIGFREWGVDHAGRLSARYQTYALSGGDPWGTPGRSAVARCGHKEPGSHHRPASAGCTCGLYGYYEIPRLYKDPILDHDREMVSGENIVFGAFVGFGEVTKHRRGFRAQKARPVALRWSPLAEKVAERYGIPICDTVGELRSAGMQWGELVDPKTLPAAGQRSSLVNTLKFGGAISSGYRSAGAQMVRAVLFLVLNHGVEIRSEPGISPMQVKYSIVGLDTNFWTLRSTNERVDYVEVPMVGNQQVDVKSGRRHIEVELEATASESDLGKAMSDLTKIGRIFKVERSFHSGGSNHYRAGGLSW